MKRLIFGLAFAALLASAPANAQIVLKQTSINSGGGTSSGGGYVLNASIGQSVAGFASSANFLHWIGFWAGEVPNPTPVNSLNEAKTLPDGTYVSIAGKLSSNSTVDYNNMAGGYFYIQDQNYLGGLRIVAPASAVAGLVRGSIINVFGTMGTAATGERQLQGPNVVIVGTTTAPNAITMRNSSVGGQNFGAPPNGQTGITGKFGLNNIGLLVRTTGKVIGKEGSILLIDDGSAAGKPVRVDGSLLIASPAIGSHIKVIGVSSILKPGADRLSIILPRNNADVAAP